jgi:hypothetical protein
VRRASFMVLSREFTADFAILHGTKWG